MPAVSAFSRLYRYCKGVTENNGVVTDIRLDIVNLSPAKTAVEEHAGDKSIVIYIDYIGFFKSVEDARNWTPAHVPQE